MTTHYLGYHRDRLKLGAKVEFIHLCICLLMNFTSCESLKMEVFPDFTLSSLFVDLSFSGEKK